jgi:hypothetical protein
MREFWGRSKTTLSKDITTAPLRLKPEVPLALDFLERLTRMLPVELALPRPLVMMAITGYHGQHQKLDL